MRTQVLSCIAGFTSRLPLGSQVLNYGSGVAAVKDISEISLLFVRIKRNQVSFCRGGEVMKR